ncbi:MAG: DUF4295 family protein [Bacteroidota bacterium]
MAKKSVGKVKGNLSKSRAQVIIPRKSSKTGAYTFQSFFVAAEEVTKLVAPHKQ